MRRRRPSNRETTQRASQAGLLGVYIYLLILDIAVDKHARVVCTRVHTRPVQPSRDFGHKSIKAYTFDYFCEVSDQARIRAGFLLSNVNQSENNIMARISIWSMFLPPIRASSEIKVVS